MADQIENILSALEVIIRKVGEIKQQVLNLQGNQRALGYQSEFTK